MANPFSQFYKKTIDERKEILTELNMYDKTLDVHATDEVFNHIIENFITTYEVPMGVAPSFLIDGKYYNVPMATEEPSVIAGATHAAKIIERNGGFKIESIQREMIGQIIFKDVKDSDNLINYLNSLKDIYFKLAKDAHPDIHRLGGGLKSYRIEVKEQGFVCLYLIIDTKDAMGANTINTIIESISNYIRSQYDVNILMSILSNLATYSKVKASVTINPRTLKNSSVIARDIESASTYASIDPFRGATHNKGIMNGITALMLATGNDTRAVEAGCHAYAAITGRYLPLAKWFVKDDQLIGEIEIPLTLGTVGGSMGILPKAKLSRMILQIQDATELMKVTACVGLAQNFAALYALTTDGINKGHMRLHARSVAVQAGASSDLIEDVVNHLIKSNDITLDEAIKYLKEK